MKILIRLSNDDGSHEEIDNLANEITSLLDDEGCENVQQEDGQDFILLTADKVVDKE